MERDTDASRRSAGGGVLMSASSAPRISWKEMACFGVFLTVVLTVFFWDMLFQGQVYLHGDYKQQYFPWASYLNNHIKHFSLPLWAPELGCGFPLLAEGQIGAFYPLHWILYLLLPFPFSYHLSFIVLFALAGFFTYLFARQFGLAASGATLATVVFLFGSSYAGLFNGVVAMRTLLWFPLSLYWTDKLLEEGRGRFAAFLALSLCFGIFGGHMQWACYSMAACVVYFFGKGYFLRIPGRRVPAMLFLAALTLGVGLAACQLLPTLELVAQSNRAGATADFALQKSLNPFALATLFWPAFKDFLGNDLYLGILPVCLAVSALFWGKERKALFLALFGLLFVLLSFGRSNLLYVLAVEHLPLRFFRQPSRLIFFASFSFSLLAGLGFDRWLEPKNGERFKALKITAVLFALAAALYAGVHMAARNFEPQIMEWARGFVEKNIFGKPGHPYTWENYSERLTALFAVLGQRTRLNEPYFLSSLGLWLGTLFFFIAGMQKKISRRALLTLGTLLTLLDLYRYADLGTGFRDNRVPASAVSSDEITDYLSARKETRFRTYEMISDSDPAHPSWLPDSSLLFGYSTIGLYSPLAMDRYKQFLKDVGGVDDSTGYSMTTRENVEKNMGLLSTMNVRYILARQSLDGVRGLTKILTGSKADILYENSEVLPRAFLDSKTGTSAVRWERDTPTDKIMSVRTSLPDSFFISNVYYPGWTAYVDGTKAPIERADGIFQRVRVPAGAHTIRLHYDPPSFRAGLCLSAVSFLILLFLLFKKTSRS